MRNLANIFKAKKLIKISISYDDKKNVIDSIKITGDFFIHPEETLETLEANLVDTKLERNEISKKVEESLKNFSFEYFLFVTLHFNLRSPS